MKKKILLLTSLFILGASSISASNTDKISETMIESNYQKWIIIVYSGDGSGTIIHQETGCYTLDTIHDRIQEFGGKYYQDDVTFDVIGECN